MTRAAKGLAAACAAVLLAAAPGGAGTNPVAPPTEAPPSARLLPAPAPRVVPAEAGQGADAPTLRASTWTPAQGDPVLVVLTLPAGAERVALAWKGRTYPMAETGEGSYAALVGVDMSDPPGEAALAVRAARGDATVRIEADLVVAPRPFPVQHLSLPRSMAEFDPPTLERIDREARALAALFDRAAGPPLWRLPFAPPVAPFEPTGFGARRFINGEPRAPHAGIDVGLPEGTPVTAVADGVVAFAGEQFFGGKSVVIDHGGGIYSVYYHLREYDVGDTPSGSPDGRRVGRGERIGTVGASGRAKSPHLHFAVRAAGGRVDPARLFALRPER